MTISYGAYLAHHGKKGQKWGVQNGPPYPLKYEDLSPEERAEAKKTAIRDGNVSEANSNRKYFTDEELDRVIKRFDLNKKLKEIDEGQYKSGLDTISEMGSKAMKLSQAIDKTNDLYNSIAKIVNTFSNENMPIVGERKAAVTSKENPKLTKLKNQLEIEIQKKQIYETEQQIKELQNQEKERNRKK